jgi:hypothetical protein
MISPPFVEKLNNQGIRLTLKNNPSEEDEILIAKAD